MSDWRTVASVSAAAVLLTALVYRYTFSLRLRDLDGNEWEARLTPAR